MEVIRPKVVDLFCGCGGLSCGFRWAGYQIIGAVDINEAAVNTFRLNFPDDQTVMDDIRRTKPDALLSFLGLRQGELDCLVGGPPCQGFSKNVPAARRFLEDPRNRLLRLFLHFVEVLRPKVVLIENVAEIVNAYDGAVSKEVLKRLNQLGFQADVKVLNSAHFGIPQFRRRAFFLANRTARMPDWPLPTHAPSNEVPLLVKAGATKNFTTVWDAISDLPSLNAGEGNSPCAYAKAPSSELQHILRDGSGSVYDHVARKLTPIQLQRARSVRQGEGLRHLPKAIRPLKGYSGAYGRLLPHEPARTITRWVFHPGSGRFVHPYDDRVITIREAARLQSFPDWFVFTGSYIQKSHQVGEAVPPYLAKLLAENLKSVL